MWAVLTDTNFNALYKILHLCNYLLKFQMLMYRWVTLSFNGGKESTEVLNFTKSSYKWKFKSWSCTLVIYSLTYRCNSYHGFCRSVRYGASLHLQKSRKHWLITHGNIIRKSNCCRCYNVSDITEGLWAVPSGQPSEDNSHMGLDLRFWKLSKNISHK